MFHVCVRVCIVGDVLLEVLSEYFSGTGLEACSEKVFVDSQS